VRRSLQRRANSVDEAKAFGRASGPAASARPWRNWLLQTSQGLKAPNLESEVEGMGGRLIAAVTVAPIRFGPSSLGTFENLGKNQHAS
jgi:hypothetical protein